MKRIFIFLLTAALLPVSVDAQEVAVERLQASLPAEISAQVLERIEEARARELPEDAVLTLALQGVAKGRSADEILDAVEELGADMSAAREAVVRGGDAPAEGEIEAATAAMRMGVDGDAVSELAGSRPSGRSLAVALLVVGGLVERGLSADDAIASVRNRLETDATDGELLGAFPDVGAGAKHGARSAARFSVGSRACRSPSLVCPCRYRARISVHARAASDPGCRIRSVERGRSAERRNVCF